MIGQLCLTINSSTNWKFVNDFAAACNVAGMKISLTIKGQLQCFSMQVVINKCLINTKKIGADPFCCFRLIPTGFHFDFDRVPL